MYATEDTYILAEYIVTDKETGHQIHKRVNLQYKRNPFNNAILGASVYGSWRNRGFWTVKDFVPEEGLTEIMEKAQSSFMEPEVVRNDEAFCKAKLDFGSEIIKFIKNLDGAEMGSNVTYGTDHGELKLGTAPITNPKNPVDVRNAFGPIDVRSM